MRNLTMVLLFFLAIIFSSGVGAEEADSTRLFFVLGMINDYLGRSVVEGDSLVEAFYPGDINDRNPNWRIFEKNLNLLLKDIPRDSMAGEADTVSMYGSAFYSKRLAAIVDSCFLFDYERPYAYRSFDRRPMPSLF
jgi:hypothetical protein